MSKGKNQPEGLKGAECFETASGRMKPGALDEYYRDAYLDNPKLSQLDVLKLAMIEAEIPDTATRQHAYQIHDRNRERINAELVKLSGDLKNLSISVIKDLMINSDSDSVKLAAAQTGTKDLFPNVSVKKVQTIDDLDQDIIRLQDEIAQAEGKPVQH